MLATLDLSVNAIVIQARGISAVACYKDGLFFYSTMIGSDTFL